MKTDDRSVFQEIKQKVTEHLDGYDKDKLQVSGLSGLTNETFRIRCQGKSSLLFRKFGGCFNRDIENEIFLALEESNIAPKCYYACEDYRIQEFIENAEHPSLNQLSNSQLKKQILQVLHRYHQNEIKILKGRPLFLQEVLSEGYIQKVRNHRQKSDNPSFKQLFDQVQQEYEKIDQLRSQFLLNYTQDMQKKVKFCHNDLNNLNIFYQPEVKLIDYQYSSYNYVYYDIANFFNECTINYQVEEFPKFRVEKRLTVDEVIKDTKLYPGSYVGIENDVLKGLAICNLYWATWSIVMAYNPSQGNFGTVQHGLARIDLYRYYKNLIN